MRDPDIAEVIKDGVDAKAVDIHTIKVGRCESYDPLTQTGDFKPVMLRAYNIGQGVHDFEELPVLPNVLVVWPRAGGFAMHFPLKKGDFVVLGFTDDNIGQWRETGSLSEPDNLRRHDLASCIAFPGVAPMLSPLSINPLDIAARIAGAMIGEDGTERQIVWTDTGIELGRALPIQMMPIALAPPTDAAIASLNAGLVALTAAVASLAAMVGSHTHPFVGVAPAANGTTAAPATPPEAPPAAPVLPGTVASTLVKAKQ